LYDKFDRHVGLIVTAFLSFTAFYEVGLSNSSVSVDLFSWIDSEYFLVSWGFTFDSLTVSMLIPIVFISSLVHMYSISYMGADPHTQRFFSYLSAFTFCMLLLVCGDNLLVLFVGWEGVGVCSYLLISFWFTRIAATKSAIQAIVTNKVGDWGMSIALFAIIFVFGNLDFSNIFSLAPYINTDILTFISLCILIGVMAKSAQLGLHAWLPTAMEGEITNNNFNLKKTIMTFIKDIKLISNNSKFINTSKEQNLGSKSLIWVYDINKQTLVENAPFSSKSACAKALSINRHTIASYLDKDKILNHKWIFSFNPLDIESLSKWLINSTV
jgi:Proton-conducting membrane transporter/NADH-Ubiquinone oxidoreductase (complex I), chain 5 N-terminus/NUMOD1 domain